MDKIPEPSVLVLDLNDENLILDMPEDREPDTQLSADRNNEQTAKKEKVSGGGSLGG